MDSAEVGRSAESHSRDLSGCGWCAPAWRRGHPLSWRGPRDRFPEAAGPNFCVSSSVPALLKSWGIPLQALSARFGFHRYVDNLFIYLFLFYIEL